MKNHDTCNFYQVDSEPAGAEGCGTQFKQHTFLFEL